MLIKPSWNVSLFYLIFNLVAERGNEIMSDLYLWLVEIKPLRRNLSLILDWEEILEPDGLNLHLIYKGIVRLGYEWY